MRLEARIKVKEEVNRIKAKSKPTTEELNYVIRKEQIIADQKGKNK